MSENTALEPLNEWSTREAHLEYLAQTYFKIWVENPKITRDQAVQIMRDRGCNLPNVQSITTITTGPYFKRLQQELIETTRARIAHSLNEKFQTVFDHQLSIASGEKEDVPSRDVVTAGRTVIDAYIRISDQFGDDHSVGAEKQVAFTVNQFFAPTVKDGGDIVEGQVVFDEEEVKRRFTSVDLNVSKDEED